MKEIIAESGTPEDGITPRLRDCLENLDITNIDEWGEAIYEWAESKGWNDPNRSQDEWAALAHTEISEAYEEYRNHRKPDEVYFSEGGKPEGIGIEYADLLIRLLHWFATYRVKPSDMLALKMRYNATRPFRHGGKKT